jgi:CRP-like cAMP-binding protein
MPADRDAIAFDAILAPLRASDLFRSLDDAGAARLARHLVRRRYRADEVIFHQGDPGDRLHVIETGRVRIGLEAQDGREGTLTILGPGRVFGELVLLDGAPRSATAIAMDPTVTVTLDRAAFRSLVDEDPAIREAVLSGVARWLRRVTDQVTELHFLDLRGRVAATLVRMAREAGPTPGPVELPALTQGEVASLVAGTRQRVNAVLGDLGREGLIAYDGKRITVLDVEQLDRRIHW